MVAGGIVSTVGVALVADAWLPERVRVYGRERRRRVRTERHHGGEAMVGLGIAALGVALIGRDLWRWSTVTVLIGAAFLVVGAALNFRYLRETFAFRGRARRGEGNTPNDAGPGDGPPLRIR